MGCLVKCSEIAVGLHCIQGKKVLSERFYFVLSLFDATQISIFMANWDFMKDDSQIGRAKKIGE